MARSISKLFAHVSVAVMAPVAIACLAPACSSDEPVAVNPGDTDTGGATGNTGGSANTGGKTNTGGSKTGGAPGSGATAGAGGSKGGSAGTGGATGGTAGAGGSTGGAGGSTGGTDAGTGGTPATGGAPVGGAGGTDGGDGGEGGNCAPLSLTAPTVTAPIQVPAGATVVKHFHAEGTQNYTCTGTVQPADAGTTYSWGASVPEADLFQGTCKVGTHYAGPWWKFTADGSAVKGAKVNAETHSGTIPWLLLNAVDHTGTGVFSDVTFIQRVDTTGGVSPSDPCDAAHVNEVKKVAYTAEYYFFEGGLGDAGP